MNTTIKIITKTELNSFVNNLINDDRYEVIGVKQKGTRFVFDKLLDESELRLDYDVTILPPKKYFLPQYEPLMTYDLTKPFEVQTTSDTSSRIIIGVHPYDIIALEQTDKIYLDEQHDDFYKKRRENTLIIGVDIQNVSPRSFAASMNTHVTETGYDLLLTNLGDVYAITVGTTKGKQLLEAHANTKDATPAEIKKIDATREQIAQNYKRTVKVDKNDWGKLLVANYAHPIWVSRSQKCMECSSCTMVCPTCYCYDVKENVSLDLEDGQRIRTWDGCLLKDFTKIASGEVFRKDISERYRHRFFRKGNYIPERYGYVACVGCGRCGTACLPDIADPCAVINDLSHFERASETNRFFIDKPTKITEKNVIHVPRSATLTRVERLTQFEMLFEIQMDDNKPLGHLPGQFVEISIFGVGEAPISISSPPSNKPCFEIVVRKVGNVTSKLFTMNAGDKLGVRGPFGNGFDMKAFEKKHLLFTTGGLGIVPLRSLIKYVLADEHRNKYKDITILYGSKCPSEVLFSDEIEQWKKVDDVRCELTVDRCADGECWTGCVGLVTTLFPKIQLDKFDSINTIAVVCGPPVMYKFVIQCLKTLGIPDENIYVSLERRMKCGVGKCGHCQINGVYVCKEGPVFNYADVRNLPEAFE